MIDGSSTPSVRDLSEALWALAATGAGLEQVLDQEPLLEIGMVLAGAEAQDEAAVAAREAIVAACRRLDDQALAVEPRWHREGAAILALLGLATGFHGAPSHRRREGAASLLGYEVGTAFKTRPGSPSHAQNAMTAVADRLWERVIRARSQHAAVAASTTRADLSALSVELLRRYEAYYAMYTPLTALRADVLTALDLRDEGDDDLNRLDDFVVSSLHAYATFLLAKRDFMERYGGVWVFGQADIEQAVADSIKLIEHFSGLRYREESVLRLTAAGGEVHPFAVGLEAEADGRAALRRWRQRILACQCAVDQPAEACRVHKLLRAAEFFTDALDADWYRVIPWHGVAPANVGVIDPATLYRDVGISPMD